MIQQRSKRTIPIAKTVMGEAEAEAAKRPIMSGWITQGPEVAAFEQEFAEFVGCIWRFWQLGCGPATK